jgi:hypothetical protein
MQRITIMATIINHMDMTAAMDTIMDMGMEAMVMMVITDMDMDTPMEMVSMAMDTVAEDMAVAHWIMAMATTDMGMDIRMAMVVDMAMGDSSLVAVSTIDVGGKEENSGEYIYMNGFNIDII